MQVSDTKILKYFCNIRSETHIWSFLILGYHLAKLFALVFECIIDKHSKVWIKDADVIACNLSSFIVFLFEILVFLLYNSNNFQLQTHWSIEHVWFHYFYFSLFALVSTVSRLVSLVFCIHFCVVPKNNGVLYRTKTIITMVLFKSD